MPEIPNSFKLFCAVVVIPREVERNGKTIIIFESHLVADYTDKPGKVTTMALEHFIPDGPPYQMPYSDVREMPAHLIRQAYHGMPKEEQYNPWENEPLAPQPAPGG